MPEFRVFLLNEPDPKCVEGKNQLWNLPWEVLVFDQRVQYQPEGADAPAQFKVRRIRQTNDGPVYDIAPDPGLLTGGDPKKDRR